MILSILNYIHGKNNRAGALNNLVLSGFRFFAFKPNDPANPKLTAQAWKKVKSLYAARGSEKQRPVVQSSNTVNPLPARNQQLTNQRPALSREEEKPKRMRQGKLIIGTEDGLKAVLDAVDLTPAQAKVADYIIESERDTVFREHDKDCDYEDLEELESKRSLRGDKRFQLTRKLSKVDLYLTRLSLLEIDDEYLKYKYPPIFNQQEAASRKGAKRRRSSRRRGSR